MNKWMSERVYWYFSSGDGDVEYVQCNSVDQSRTGRRGTVGNGVPKGCIQTSHSLQSVSTGSSSVFLSCIVVVVSSRHLQVTDEMGSPSMHDEMRSWDNVIANSDSCVLLFEFMFTACWRWCWWRRRITSQMLAYLSIKSKLPIACMIWLILHDRWRNWRNGLGLKNVNLILLFIVRLGGGSLIARRRLATMVLLHRLTNATLVFNQKHLDNFYRQTRWMVWVIACYRLVCSWWRACTCLYDITWTAKG